MIPRSEYTTFVPGSHSNGSAKILASVSCLLVEVRQYSLNGGSPEVCVIKLRTVTLCRHSGCGPFSHSGKYRSIGASRFRGEGKSPSASFSTSVVVTTTFVSEAMSYIVSAFTVGDFASYFCLPNACTLNLPLKPTASVAPGNALSAMAFSTTS